MSFYCVASAGHAVVLVKLRADGGKGVGEPQSVPLDWSGIARGSISGSGSVPNQPWRREGFMYSIVSKWIITGLLKLA
jgi:hypothetical protein